MRTRNALILGSALLLSGLAAAAWTMLRPVPVPVSSGWLCCVTSPASGITVCVQVKGLDSECTGGTIGWCDDILTEPSGAAKCLDT